MRVTLRGIICLFLILGVPWLAAAADTIIDNGATGSTATGTWFLSSGRDPYGSTSLYSKEANASYVFEAPVSGIQDLYMWWTVYSDRGTSIPVEIYDAGVLIDTVLIDQQINGGQWNFIGTYSFSGTARVVIVNPDGEFSTCADAVRLVPLAQAGAPVVTITFPASYHLQVSPDLIVRANARNLENGWGVRFLLDAGTTEERSIVDYSAPFEAEFFGISRAEHILNAVLVDADDMEILGDYTRDQVIQIGIGDYYVAIGDSITEGYLDDFAGDNISLDGRDNYGGFEPVLNDLLTGIKGVPQHIVNEGIGGDLSDDGKNIVQFILAKHPDAEIFLVQYGTNDSTWESIPSGLGLLPGDAGYASSFKDNMQQIIDDIQGAGKEVYLAKVPIALGDSSAGIPFADPEGEPRNQLIREYNQVIDGLVLSNHIAVSPPDFYSYFSSVDPATGKYRYEEEYADNLHPNGVGYGSMAKLWADAIQDAPDTIPSPSPWSSRQVNFQPADSVVPSGYLADSGGAFNSALGYGWVQAPDSLGTRDRNNSASPDQAHDTLIHVAPTGVWEMAVPNGTYQVTVCVGDPTWPDSRHSVQVEGVSAIDDGYLDASTEWIEATVTVAVTDGALTLTFSGSEPYAKPDWLKIVVDDGSLPTPPPPSSLSTAVNFQPAESVVPSGYLADSGGAFNSALGYGWVQPPDSLGTRDRNNSSSPDQAYDTLIHVAPTGVWEMAVPNGTYQVTVCVGDPTWPDSRQSVQVEGVSAIDGDLDASTKWIEATVTVAVEDGALTLTFSGSEPYAKPDWLKIVADDGELPPPPPPPSSSTAINFQPADSVVPSGYAIDSGLSFDATRGYGWVQAPDSLGTRDRNNSSSPDQAYDTLIHVAPTGVWEMVVPNGTYQVTVCVGDPTWPDSRHSVQVEGGSAIDGDLDASTKWIEATVTVAVEDGALTLTFSDSEPYAKTDWLQVVAID
jgi:lysophospholipase L1-like esterase